LFAFLPREFFEANFQNPADRICGHDIMIYYLLRISKLFIVNLDIHVYRTNEDLRSNQEEGSHSWQADLTLF